MIARAFGVDLPLYAFMVIMPPVILLTIIPISLAGWGVREVSMVSLLSYSGIAQETALSKSIIFGFTYVIQGLLGLYFFIKFWQLLLWLYGVISCVFIVKVYKYT